MNKILKIFGKYLFHCEVIEMFCGRDFTWLSISMDGGGDGGFFLFLGEVFFQRKTEATK